MPSGIMLNVIMLSAVMLCVVVPNAIKQCQTLAWGIKIAIYRPKKFYQISKLYFILNKINPPAWAEIFLAKNIVRSYKFKIFVISTFYK
jgi:hypothetical protein